MPRELPIIATPERKLDSTSLKQHIHDIVTQHNVCGFVVSWPLEQDTGKLGAKCGRVWYTLEALQQQQGTTSTSFEPPFRVNADDALLNVDIRGFVQETVFYRIDRTCGTNDGMPFNCNVNSAQGFTNGNHLSDIQVLPNTIHQTTN